MEVKKILFRCSRLGELMTEPRTKMAKEAGELSETAKRFIEDIWLQEVYGYREEVIDLEIFKGILCEQDSIGLAQRVLGGEFRMTFKKLLKNDYLKGTPDIVLSDYVEDIKTSYTLKTFFRAELTANYYWQLQGYMALTGRKKARLIYCLVDTPSEIVTELKKRVYFQFNCDETHPDYIRLSKQIEKNHTVSHIPERDRVKVYEIAYNEAGIQLLYQKIDKAREYMAGLKLNKTLKLNKL